MHMHLHASEVILRCNNFLKTIYFKTVESFYYASLLVLYWVCLERKGVSLSMLRSVPQDHPANAETNGELSWERVFARVLCSNYWMISLLKKLLQPRTVLLLLPICVVLPLTCTTFNTVYRIKQQWASLNQWKTISCFCLSPVVCTQMVSWVL